jgi:large subunit ribosomal protein L6
MSRVGKKPISIPEKIKVTHKDGVVTVQGKNGTLTQAIHPAVTVDIDNGAIPGRLGR